MLTRFLTILAMIVVALGVACVGGPTPTPVPPVPPVALTLVCVGSGAVSGQSCNTTNSYPSNTVIPLAAIANIGNKFQGWGGDCAGSGTNANCPLTMSSPKNVTATFVNQNFALNLTCNGSGTVTVGPQQVCGTTIYPYNASISLAAGAAIGNNFQGWGSDCAGSGINLTCPLTMTSDKNVTANFVVQTFKLTIDCTGAGIGTVTVGSQQGCGTTKSYPSNAPISLTATVTTGNIFQTWSGACLGAGTNPNCQFALTSDQNVGATFGIKTWKLTVRCFGAGSGSVSPLPCSRDVSPTPSSHLHSTPVTLTAQSGFLSTFKGWENGDCSGNSTCILTMTKDMDVTATFCTPAC